MRVTHSKFRFPSTFPLLHRSLILVAALSVWANSAFAQELQPVSITYSISLESDRIGNATLGRIETKLSKAGQTYSVLSATQAEGMAAILLGSNFQEACDFTIEDGRAVSATYAGGRDNLSDYRVGFDWKDRKINFDGGETLDMPQGYIVDNCNMLFAASLFGDKNLGEQSLYIVDGKKRRIRGYRLLSSQAEKLDSNIGVFDTLKIVLVRELVPERTITLWLSNEHNHLPLKMVEQRRKRTTIFTVDQLEPS